MQSELVASTGPVPVCSLADLICERHLSVHVCSRRDPGLWISPELRDRSSEDLHHSARH